MNKLDFQTFLNPSSHKYSFEVTKYHDSLTFEYYTDCPTGSFNVTPSSFPDGTEEKTFVLRLEIIICYNGNDGSEISAVTPLGNISQLNAATDIGYRISMLLCGVLHSNLSPFVPD